VYDNLYRNTAEKWYDGTTLVRTLSFTYDAASQLTAASDPAASLAYTYDQLGRVTAEAQTIAGLTPVITYQSQYDAASRRTQLLALIGGTADFKNVFTYDNLSRLTVVKQQGTAGGHAVAEKRADLAYDAASAFKTIDRYADLAGFEHVVSTHYSYDGMGRISKLLHTEGPTAPGSGWGTDALAGYEYAYDAASRFTSINSFADGLTNYTHDNTDQLTGADHTGQIDETYTYDANGNRTMTGYSTGSNNQLTTDGTNNYTYDDEGNRLTKTRISNGEKEEYTWDHRNRLTKVTFRNASGTVVKTVDQSYDVFNQWIRRTVDPDGTTGSAALQDTFFSHEGGEINLDFDGSTTGDLTHRYLFNPAAVDQLLADETVTSLLTAGTTLWTLADHLGTLRDLATYNASTDDTAVANHRRFDSFGRLISETNSAIDTIFAFTSRPFDESTGLQNNLNRWYDVQLGQWLSEDPLSYHDGYNLRRYVSNAAVSSIDPFGLIAHVPLIIQKAWEVGQVIETAAGYLPPLPSQELTCGVGGTFGIGSSFILSRDDGFRAFLESEYWHPTYNVHVKPTHVLVKVTIKLMECDAVFNDDIITITSQEIFSVSSALSSPMISYDVTVDFQYVCTADGLKISTKDGSSTGLALDPFQNTVELCYGVLWEVAPVWDSTADPRAQEVQKSFFVNPDVYVFPQRLRKLERTRDLFSVKCCCSA
jgi:RHS repeat-associated protein